MKYLFIDTETTGIPKNRELSPMNVENWPRLVSFAYILCNQREVIDKNSFIIKPHGFIIPSDSTKVHGITTSEAISQGRDISTTLEIIKQKVDDCDYIVGHNVIFDINVLNAEFYRHNGSLPVGLKPYLCTMTLSKDYCALPNNKYPTLDELYTILKGKSIFNAHNAMIDAQASMECFWILKDIGLVNSNIKKPTINIYPTEDNISWATEHISMEYAAKAYAYLTLACNLLYNKSNFLKSKDDYDSISDLYLDRSFANIDDRILERLDEKTQKEFEYYSKDLTCTKNPQKNSEWIKSMFNFLKIEIQKTSASVSFNKFDGSRYVVVRPYLRYHLKEIEKESGGKELINKFKLEYPDSPSASLILEDESSWVDIAIETVKTRTQPTCNMGNEPLLQEAAEGYFISMIEYFNKIRETEQNKRIDEWNKRLEKSLSPETLKETEKIISVC